MGQFKPMVKMETTEPSVELKLKKGGEVKKQMGGSIKEPMNKPMPGVPARGGSSPAASPLRPSMSMRRRSIFGGGRRGMPAPSSSDPRTLQELSKYADMKRTAPPRNRPSLVDVPSGGGRDPNQESEMMKAGQMAMAARPTPAARPAVVPTPTPRPAPMPQSSVGYKKGGESKAEHKAEMTKMASTAKKLQEHASKPASKAHKGLKTGGVANAQGGYKKGGGYKTAWWRGEGEGERWWLQGGRRPKKSVRHGGSC
jgi:hypothetical protein